MRKKEFTRRYFNFVRTLDLAPKEVRVAGGGTMLLLGLRDVTEDLDLDVSPELYKRLVDTNALPITTFEKGDGQGEFAKWDDYIDLHPESNVKEGIFIDGVWSTTPEAVLELKKTLNRDKDQNDIRILEKFIKK